MRHPREQLTCSACGWVGVTALGRVRWIVFGLSSAAVASMVALELAGLTQLGDQLWAIAITIMLVSIGLRLLIRGDRCRECGGSASYIKKRPPSSDGA